MKHYSINFFEFPNGKMPVVIYIKGKDAEMQGRVERKFDLLKIYGPFLSKPHSRYLGKKIYELRPEGMRLLYYWRRDEAVFVHAVDKKDFSQEDIKIAAKRKR
jgi:hypothetical protein